MNSVINPELIMNEEQYERYMATVSPLMMLQPEVMAPAALDRMRQGKDSPLARIFLERAGECHLPDAVEQAFDHFCSFLMDPNQDPSEYLRTLHPDRMPVGAELLLNSGPQEPKWIVKDLLPQGLTVLAAPPKAGKSWLSLALCLAVASGKPFLGHDTRRGGVLYLDLEDSLARLAERLRKLCGEEKCPPNFCVQLDAASLRQGLGDALRKTLRNLYGTQLVIVDTLQKIRGVRTSQDVYGSDYADLGALKRIADERDIAILVVHHTRKGSDGSPFERISGSNGVTGAADTEWVLLKEKQGSTLHITGRDVCMDELPLRFNKDTCRWENGNAGEQDPGLIDLCEALTSGPDGAWEGTAQGLMDEAGKAGIRLNAGGAKYISTELEKLEPFLAEKHGIRVDRARTAKARLIRLSRQAPPDDADFPF